MSEQVHSALDAIRFAPTDADAQAYLDEAIVQAVASERERAAKAKQRARVWKRAAKERHAALIAEYTRVKAVLEVAGVWEQQCEAAEQQARANEAEAAYLRSEIVKWLDADETPEFDGVEADFVWLAQRLRMDDRPLGFELAAALDAWCAWLEHNTMLKDGKMLVLATPREKALYQVWRGECDE